MPTVSIRSTQPYIYNIYRLASTNAPAVAELTIKDATHADTGFVRVTNDSSTSSSSSTASNITKHAKNSTGVWQRFTAFITGIGVSSIVLYMTIQRDIDQSTTTLENSINNMKTDTLAANKELRERVAVLEHKLALLLREKK